LTILTKSTTIITLLNHKEKEKEMKKFYVDVLTASGDITEFTCNAKNHDHAREQAQAEYPGNEILSTSDQQR
jgi:hypothetical protein